MQATVHVHVNGKDAGGEQTIIIPREAISCPMCLEPFETAEPRTPCVLHCYHTICRECLAGWVEKGGGVPEGGAEGVEAASGFSCPMCRTVCTDPVEALPVNFALMTVIEAECVSTGKTKLVCQRCEEDDPTYHCLECSLLMCDACTKDHRRIKLSKHHTLQPIEEFKQRKQAIPKQKRTCTKHKDQGLDLYCLTCLTPICFHGTFKDHKGHEYELLSDVAGIHQVCRPHTQHAHNTHTTRTQSQLRLQSCSHAHARIQ